MWELWEHSIEFMFCSRMHFPFSSPSHAFRWSSVCLPACPCPCGTFPESSCSSILYSLVGHEQFSSFPPIRLHNARIWLCTGAGNSGSLEPDIGLRWAIESAKVCYRVVVSSVSVGRESTRWRRRSGEGVSIRTLVCLPVIDINGTGQRDE